MTKKHTLAAAVVVLLAAASLSAQTPLVTGLQTPTRMIFTPSGNLAVAESGTTAANSGRVSVVNRTNGERRTLIDGLPSAVDPEGAPSGPSALALQGNTLYILIGAGNGVLPGPAPGTEQANPTPSSPIISSLLSLTTNQPLDLTAGGFSLVFADHSVLKNGQSIELQNVLGERATLRLVADFPNFTNEPRPDFLANVRASNPFGLAVQGNSLYVADASQDIVRRVETTNGSFTTLSTFPKVTNPTPVGPPVIDSVPNSARLHGNDLLVTTLTGFPFAPGVAEVRRVNTASGANTRVAGGLTTAIDSFPLGNGPNDSLLVLEFSTNLLNNEPGRLLMVNPSNGSQTVLADDLISPTSMAVDQRSGEVFILHIFPGTIDRFELGGTIPAVAPTAIIPVVANIFGALNSHFSTSLQLTNPFPTAISGRIVIHPAGEEGSGDDPSLSYVLAPFETRYYPELLLSANTAGSGSADIIAAVGGAPAAIVRIAEKASATNPEVQVPVVRPADALQVGQRSLLVSPPTARYRFNIGVRTLGNGATLTFHHYNPAGALTDSVTHTFGPNFFQQYSASALMGESVGTNETIIVEVEEGSAIVYGTTVENLTSSMSIQLAAPIEE